ncbi:MAG TPA: DMT family transporter [Solirubrobacterales bacterium]|jgi:drug/metabolite transporter (DMT)-like permease
MEIALAVVSAFFFALGTVLQQRGAVAEPSGASARGVARLLARLARRPVWIGGILADGVGFACQAVALGIGRLVVVQPILATSVVFSLPLGARLTHQRVRRRDVLGAAAATSGLAIFLVVGDPTAGRDDAPFGDWLLALVAIAALSAVLLAAGLRGSPGVKAALLGTASGLLFGLGAALTKATVAQVDEGVLHVLGTWHLYGLLVVGYVGMTLSQMALQTGVLAPAMATFNIVDAVTSVVLGVTLFHEALRDDPLGITLDVAALAVMFAGLIVLAGAEGAGHGDVAAEGRAQPEPARSSFLGRR